MYDDELNRETFANTQLWEYLENVVPTYIEKFGIDGIMLDMGHALPDLLLKRIIGRIRAVKPDFLLFEENFNITEESKEIGYDAVVGYMPFDMHRPEKLYEIFKRYEAKDFPINFFGTAENHNTPRAASRFNDINFSKMTYLINALFPTITFIHNGFELGETRPVNTGLDFTDEEIEKFKPEELPLFSYSELNWLNKENIIDFIMEVNQLKVKSDLSKFIIERTEEGLSVKYDEYELFFESGKIVHILFIK
jgi:glycosidase